MPREQRPEPRLGLDDPVGQGAIPLPRLARQPRQPHLPRQLAALDAPVAVGLDEPREPLALGEHGVHPFRGLDQLPLVLVARIDRGIPIRQHLRLYQRLELVLEIVHRRLHGLHNVRR